MHSDAVTFARFAASFKPADTPGISRTSEDSRVTGRPATVCVDVMARVSCRAVSQSAITAAHHPRQSKKAATAQPAMRGSLVEKSHDRR
jgi:hypothetical protein